MSCTKHTICSAGTEVAAQIHSSRHQTRTVSTSARRPKLAPWSWFGQIVWMISAFSRFSSLAFSKRFSNISWGEAEINHNPELLNSDAAPGVLRMVQRAMLVWESLATALLLMLSSVYLDLRNCAINSMAFIQRNSLYTSCAEHAFMHVQFHIHNSRWIKKMFRISLKKNTSLLPKMLIKAIQINHIVIYGRIRE